MTTRKGLALTFLLIVAGLAGRSALDKLLTLHGGVERVALWAQVMAVIEIVIGVAAAGVGTGLVVYVSRSSRADRQREFLHESIRLSLRVTLPVAAACGLAGWMFSDALSGGRIAPQVFAVAAVAGWIGVIPMLVYNFWLGQQRRGPMLVLVLASAALLLPVPVFAPESAVLALLAIGHAMPAAALLLIPAARDASNRFRRRLRPLRRYILPGLAVGIFGPLSMMVARGAIGDSLAWHEAGVFQALTRLSDWVCAIAQGFLSLHYLPRYAAAQSGPRLAAEMRDTAKKILLPSAIVFAAFFLWHRPLLALLYDPSVQASDMEAGLFFAGSLLRIAAWIPLLALYALRRTRELTIGEFLSLPLFAALTLLAGGSITLELAGGFWMLAYLAYGAYNLYAFRNCQRRNSAT